MKKWYVTVIQHIPPALGTYRLRIRNFHSYGDSPEQIAKSHGSNVRSSTIGGLNGHTVYWYTADHNTIISVEETLLS